MPLTQRERVIAQIQHQETDYLPYTIRFDSDLIDGMDCYGTDIAARLDTYYHSPVWRDLVDNAIPQFVTHNLGVNLSSDTHYTDAYGCVWRTDRRPFNQIGRASCRERV